MKIDLSPSDLTIVRQALNLRASQLRRVINAETDVDVLRIRQAQFKAVDALIVQFSPEVKQ